MFIQKSEKIKIHVANKLIKAGKYRLDRGASTSILSNIQRIGSSFRNGDVARGLNRDEEKLFMPSIIGVHPDNIMQWENSVKDYWKNVTWDVAPPDIEGKGGGLELEIGWEYNNEEDAKAGEKERRDEWAKLREIVLEKNAGEYEMSFAVRTRLGRPINIAHYMCFRYCLIYSEVAKFPELEGKSPRIRFYMTSPAYDEAKQYSVVTTRIAANTKLASLIQEPNKVYAVLLLSKTLLDTIRTDDKRAYPLDSPENRIIAIERIATKFPTEFLQLASDEAVMEKAKVEQYINKGLLKRIVGTNAIIYGDNMQIGNSLTEVVAFLKLEKNLPIKQELDEKLKLAK